MSRKFLRDNGLFLGTNAELPPNGAGTIKPGTAFFDQVTGAELHNEGVADDAMFFDKSVGPDLLEQFIQAPGVNGDRDSAAANTYSTTGLQTNLDTNPNWEVAGTNATSALVTFAATGGITLTTAGAAADQMLLQPHTNTKASMWNAIGWQASKRCIFDTTIFTGASVAGITLIAGYKLTNTPAIATDADQAYFRFSTGDTIATAFQTITRNNTGTNDVQTTGVVVAAATSYRLQIKADKSLVPWYFINGVLVRKGIALKANTSLKPFFGVQAIAVAAKAMTIRYVRGAQKF